MEIKFPVQFAPTETTLDLPTDWTLKLIQEDGTEYTVDSWLAPHVGRGQYNVVATITASAAEFPLDRGTYHLYETGANQNSRYKHGTLPDTQVSLRLLLDQRFDFLLSQMLMGCPSAIASVTYVPDVPADMQVGWQISIAACRMRGWRSDVEQGLTPDAYAPGYEVAGTLDADTDPTAPGIWTATGDGDYAGKAVELQFSGVSRGTLTIVGDFTLVQRCEYPIAGYRTYLSRDGNLLFRNNNFIVSSDQTFYPVASATRDVLQLATPVPGSLGAGIAASATPATVWTHPERTLTGADAGTGSVLYTWKEYEAGHNNDPNFAVPDVTVTVYSNDIASGAPIAKGVTDETGSIDFYLDPGTYYIFRRKAGRKFTNPATVEVNWGGNTDQEPENPSEIAFTWTEYETGHAGDPSFVVENVWVRVFTNNRGSGTPEAMGTTGANGSVTFYLPARTYYLFRYKSGRVFNNPFTVEVS